MQQAFDYYARYYVESFRLPTMSNAAVARPFTIEGWQQVLDGLEVGNGVILALPHLGGWEWAGRWMTDQGFKMTVVVEALDPPELFEWFADLRKDLGMTVVPTGPKAGPAVLRALRANETVCLLCDRDLDRSGVEVEFFGERTTLPAGPATLAIRTGAPLLPVGCYFTAKYNGHHAVVRPAVPTVRRRRPARRRRPGDAGAGTRTRVPDPPSPRTVASVPTKLAARPRIQRLAIFRNQHPTQAAIWAVRARFADSVARPSTRMGDTRPRTTVATVHFPGRGWKVHYVRRLR